MDYKSSRRKGNRLYLSSEFGVCRIDVINRISVSIKSGEKKIAISIINKIAEVFYMLITSTKQICQRLDSDHIQFLEKPGTAMTLQLQSLQKIRIRYGQ